MTRMRAKLQIATVTKVNDECEQLTFHGVGPNQYGADGLDEDNTFAKFTPCASLNMAITNPALIGKFEPGQKFHVDFTPAN